MSKERDRESGGRGGRQEEVLLEQLMHNVIVLNGEEKGNKICMNVRYRCSVHMESNLVVSLFVICSVSCLNQQTHYCCNTVLAAGCSAPSTI